MNLFVHYLKSTLHRVDDFDLSVGRQHFHAASPIYSSLSTSQRPELNTFIRVKEKKCKHILANNNNGFFTYLPIALQVVKTLSKFAQMPYTCRPTTEVQNNKSSPSHFGRT